MEVTKDILYIGVNDHLVDLFEGQVDFLARSQSLSLRYRAASSLYTREPFLYPHRVSFGPGGVNLSGGGKALRKMQHSCIF